MPKSKWSDEHPEQVKLIRRRSMAKRRLENRESMAAYQKDWRASHRLEINEQKREANQRYKRTAMDLVGGRVCVGCGSTDMAALSLDHIKGDGAAHRKLIGNRNMYSWVIANPEDRRMFRVLCMSCQFLARAKQLPIDAVPGSILLGLLRGDLS